MTGQSLGNLKPPLPVCHYLMYTVCPIADRDLVFDMKLYPVRRTSARAHKRSPLFREADTPFSSLRSHVDNKTNQD